MKYLWTIGIHVFEHGIPSRWEDVEQVEGTDEAEAMLRYGELHPPPHYYRPGVISVVSSEDR